MRHRQAAWIAAVLLLAPAALPAQATTSSDEREVLAVMEKVWQGMKTRDTVLLKSVFHPEARLFGIRSRRDGAEVTQATPASEFINFVGRAQGGAWIERTFNPEVRISGPLATIWAEYDFHLGTEFSHCGIDAFQLLKTSEGWRIVSVADTFVREGCTRRPPPA